MLSKQWNNLPNIWKAMVYKEWLLFLKYKFPLSTFLWDDSNGVDFLLCKVLNIESNSPNTDLEQLELLISNGLMDLNENALCEIFSMQFLTLSPEITYLFSLKYFQDVKIVDFHCQNESKITDFEVLHRNNVVYVLDYADYQIVDFDKYSNIRDIENIRYIKGYGFPADVNCVFHELNEKYRTKQKKKQDSIEKYWYMNRRKKR